MELRTSTELDKLALALSKCQAKLEAIGKDKEARINSPKGNYSYKYADLASVWDAARAHLAENELSVFQAPFPAEDGIGMVTRLLHSSGQWIENSYVLPMALEKSGKDGPYPATPQEIGSGITYARRYGLACALGLTSSEEDDDAGRAETAARATPRRAASPPARAASAAQAAPAHRGPDAHAQRAPASSGGPTLGPDGKPKWYRDRIGGKGEWSFQTWEHMGAGSADGRRHGWLRWAFANTTVDSFRAKCAWVLQNCYGDDVDRELERMTSGVAKPTPEPATVPDDDGWEPGAGG